MPKLVYQSDRYAMYQLPDRLEIWLRNGNTYFRVGYVFGKTIAEAVEIMKCIES